MEMIPTVRAPRDSAARAFYLAYLRTPAWRQRRNRSLRLAGFKCERCGSKREFEVHHKSYERLGAELDSDLEVLCSSCHDGHHHDEGVQSHTALYVNLVADVVRLEPDLVGADLMEAVKARAARLQIPYRADRLALAVDVVFGRRKAINVPTAVGVETGTDWANKIGKAEAVSICRQLGLKVPLRTMPKAKRLTQLDVDKARAIVLIAGAIEAQARLCDALDDEPV